MQWFPKTISIQVPCDGVFVNVVIKQRKTITRFGFCNILNNRGLCKCHLPRPFPARQITLTLTSTLIISDITNTSSNNCLLSAVGLGFSWALVIFKATAISSSQNTLIFLPFCPLLRKQLSLNLVPKAYRLPSIPFSGNILFYWRHFTGYRKRVFQIWLTLSGYGELTAGFEPIRNGDWYLNE